MAIDTSALFRRPPSLSQSPEFLGTGVAALARALAQRNAEGRDMEEMQLRMSRQGVEDRLRQQQEARLRDWQQGQLQLDRDRFEAEQRQKGASAAIDAYTKNPQSLPFVAQAYGGKVEDVMDEPPPPTAPALAGLDEDPTAAPAMRQATPTGKKRLTMPGAGPIEFSPPADDDYHDRMLATLDQLQPGPSVQMLRTAIEQQRAAKVSGREGLEDFRGVQEGVRRADLQRELTRLRGSRSGGITPSKAADDRRADYTAFRSAAKDWESAANIDKLTDAYDKFSEMMANVNDAKASGDVISERSALYQAARYITGPGVLTPQEYENTVSNTGGLVTSALTKLTKAQEGDISEPEKKALEKFVSNANKAVQRRAQKALAGFDRRFGAGLAAENPTMRGEAAAYRKELQSRFGLSDSQAMQRGSGGHDEADALLKGLR